MINSIDGTAITFTEYKEMTCFRMPKTEEAELARIAKLLRTMQKQGQFQELEVLYRLLRLMCRPEDDGELGLQLFSMLKIHGHRQPGTERDVISYLMQKTAQDLPFIK